MTFLISIVLFAISLNLENVEQLRNKVSYWKQVSYSKPITISFSYGEKKDTEEHKEKTLTDYEWALSIPIIDLLAPIQEGTSNQVMEETIGHFEETASLRGNIGLAAHNRGYRNNYFARLKELKTGDVIYYKRLEETKVYKVEEYTIIRQDDWRYLEDTKDNRLTLITCVENQPLYRRCVQAMEIRKEESDEKKNL